MRTHAWIAAGALCAAALFTGCSSAEPRMGAGAAAPARLIVVTETTDESAVATEFPAMTYRPARVLDGRGALVAQIVPHREPGSADLPPGRYTIVSSVNGAERAVVVDLAPGERKVISVRDLAAGSSVDG